MESSPVWQGTVLGVFTTWVKCKILVWVCPPWLQYAINYDDLKTQMQNINVSGGRLGASVGTLVTVQASYVALSCWLFTQLSLWQHSVLLEALTCFVPRLLSGFWRYIKLDKMPSAEDLSNWHENRNLPIAYLIACWVFSDLHRFWLVARWTLLYIFIPGGFIGMGWFCARFDKPYSLRGLLWPALAMLGQIADSIDLIEEYVVLRIPLFLRKIRFRFERRFIWGPNVFRHHSIKQYEIRLLMLRKATGPFVLLPEMSIVTVDLFATNLPKYEAISYQWGSSELTDEILVNGMRFPVTASALKALSARGSSFYERLVWIDSICIDQSNETEKSQQVQIMAQIYFKASRVIVCPMNVWRPRLVAWTMILYQRSPSIDDADSEQPIDHFRAFKMGIIPPRWLALSRFVQNDYFSRAWIVQEVAAGCNVQILLGDLYVPWLNLYGLCNHAGDTVLDLWQLSKVAVLCGSSASTLSAFDQLKLRTQDDKSTNIKNITALRGDFDLSVTDAVPITLERTLLETQGFRATDPRDFVFAMTAMARYDRRTEALKPDYSCSAAGVYERTAMALFLDDARPCLDLLALAGTGSSKKSLTLPSWVPDFGRGLQPQPLTASLYGDGKYSASAETQVTTRRGDVSGTLSVRGLVCDFIECISTSGPLILFETDQGKAISSLEANRRHSAFLRGIFDLIDSWSRGKEERSDQAAVLKGQAWRTVVGDRMNMLAGIDNDKAEAFTRWVQHVNAMSSVRTSTEWMDFVKRNSSQGGVLQDSVAITRFSFAFVTTCLDRCFAISGQGRACLVPARSKAGDQIFIPFGSQVPFLIRKFPSMLGHDREIATLYELVGECFVQGMMMGEALNDVSVEESWVTLG